MKVPGFVKVLASLMLVFCSVLWPCSAFADDTINTWKIQIDFDDLGVAHVKEEIDYVFGLASGKHGMTRFLRIREGFDSANDIKYSIRNIDVTSEDAASDFVLKTVKDARTEDLAITVGTPYSKVTQGRATYHFSYDVVGGVRVEDGKQVFSWPVIANAPIQAHNIDLQIAASKVLTCGLSDGSPCKKQHTYYICSSRGLSEEKELRINAELGSRISSASIKLVQRGDYSNRIRIGVILGLTGASSLGCLILAPIILRRKRRDFRFSKLPAGTLPKQGKKSLVSLERGRPAIPPRNIPPDGSLAEIFLLAKGKIGPKAVAATLLDLASRGGVQLVIDSQGRISGKLVDESVGRFAHELVLLDLLFAGNTDWVRFDNAGEFAPVAEKVCLSVRNQVSTRDWFCDIRPVWSKNLIGVLIGLMLVSYLYLSDSGARQMLFAMLPLVPLCLLYLVSSRKRFWGQRTALGRALTDQHIGYAGYISTVFDEKLPPQSYSLSDLVWGCMILERVSPDSRVGQLLVPGSWLLVADNRTTFAVLQYACQVLTDCFTPITKKD